jgi:peptide/nickel transport system substrate-binding protein
MKYRASSQIAANVRPTFSAGTAARSPVLFGGTMKKKIGVSALLLGLAISPSLYAKDGAAPVAGGEIRFGVTGEPACFNPHRSNQQNAFIVARNYVDSLVGKGTQGDFLPWLAKEWSISPDGKEYVFTLRDDVLFHDGEKFDANAVKANFEFIKNKENAVLAGDNLRSFDHAEVLSPTRIKLVLTQSDSGFLESVSSIRLGILSPKNLKKDEGFCAGGPELIATGPFRFENYTRGQSASFVKFAEYKWGPGYAIHQGPAWLDRVTFRFLPEYTVRTGALESGQVDVIEGVQPTDIGLFKDRPGYQFLRGPSGAQTAFTLNINYTIPPATDVRVRRALRDGADIDALVKSVYLGTVPRAWSNIAPDNYFTNQALVGSWGNNVAAANKLLDEAGWTGRDSEGFRTKDGQRLTIEVGYPQPFVRDSRDILIQGLQSELRKNLGFNLALRIISNGEWSQQKDKASWTIYPNTYLPADAAQELSANIGEAGFIRAAADKGDKELFGLINAALKAIGRDDKKKLVDAAQARAVDQAFIVPLFAANYQLAAKDFVHGLSFETQLDSPSNFYDVWIAK